MDSIRIQGGIALQGKVRVQGSKNASLPVLAATLLVGGSSFIRNCPRIADVHAMVCLLKSLGCTVRWQETGIVVDSSQVRRGEMSGEAVAGMRSSLCLLGALIGRCGEAVMEYPGGCVIGRRPIDMHLCALEQMGVEFHRETDKLRACAAKLHGACIRLPFPSVGATENVVLAGVMAEGETVLEGAALEPEIVSLCRYLSDCGAFIQGAGSSRIVIHGGRRLWGTEFCGLEVKSPEALKNLPEDCGIFICNIYYKEIREQILEMGVKNPIEYFNDEYMPSFYLDRLEMKEAPAFSGN